MEAIVGMLGAHVIRRLSRKKEPELSIATGRADHRHPTPRSSHAGAVNILRRGRNFRQETHHTRRETEDGKCSSPGGKGR